MVHKVLIIGSGPAGLTAAIYAARNGWEPLLLEGTEPGGPLAAGSYKIENYPGFSGGASAADLIGAMRKQAENFGAKFAGAAAESVDFSRQPLTVSAGGKKYQAEAVIVATGTEPKKLGLESETRFAGRGVSYCATCDGPLFKNKKVVVLGGGNSALYEAMFLANFASEVALIDVLDFSYASGIVREKAKKNPKIKWFRRTEIKEFAGDKKLEKVSLYNNETKKESEMPADGVFIAIGREPNTKIFEGKLKMKDGYIATDCDSTKTSADGVFAAGDAADPKFRQAITAAGRGCMAALEADKYLRNK